ncbi:MAG: T9SS type A sorting domain-containing protein [Bacteroidota bacterium]
MLPPKVKLLCLFLLLAPILALAQINPQFNPIPPSHGINSPNPVYALNIKYDNIEPQKQKFHLFLPDTTGSYPLVVFIHGGGFTGGSPNAAYGTASRRADIKYFLENGYAYASFGYRLIATNQPDPDGVIKCLSDSKRALQFVRYYASDLKIDPERIALTGGSAGAGTSLWLGTRPNMADPGASDPVLRESTRVCAVVLNGSQSTYDLYRWETEIFDNFDGMGTNYTLDSMVNLLGYQRASNFYGGLDSIYQIIHDPALIQYRQDVDMLYHLSSDDPPIYISSYSPAVHPGQDLFHHSFHGREIQDVALAANVSEVKADIPALSINTTNGESKNDFVIRHLSSCVSVASAPPTNSSLQATAASLSSAGTALRVAPNPASDHVVLSWPETAIRTVEMYAISGQLVRQFPGNFLPILDLSTDGLAPGIYVLRVISEAGALRSQKVVIE